MTTLLIDGDMLAYRAATSPGVDIYTDWGEDLMTHHADIGTGIRMMHEMVASWEKVHNADGSIVCLSCPTRRYWRHDIYPAYKASRSSTPPPMALHRLKASLRNEFETFERPGLEADDVLGILHTGAVNGVPKYTKIVAQDKDMLSIPGLVWNPVTGQMHHIATYEADRWHMMQTLTGDPTDGYTGLPGCGPKTAEKILGFGTLNMPEMWEAVVKAYAKAKLTEEDALLQARVARICRHADYDFVNKEVKLWCPPPH